MQAGRVNGCVFNAIQFTRCNVHAFDMNIPCVFHSSSPSHSLFQHVHLSNCISTHQFCLAGLSTYIQHIEQPFVSMASYDEPGRYSPTDGLLEDMPEKPPRPLYQRKQPFWRRPVSVVVHVAILAAWVTVAVFAIFYRMPRANVSEIRNTYCKLTQHHPIVELLVLRVHRSGSSCTSRASLRGAGLLVQGEARQPVRGRAERAPGRGVG